ncbi:unnamed protein product [Lactuca virosa]|uniref:Uncharacterized protein n=1 Tax=Lactuca virosa TaxID=75947 RepID=A0AAU9NB41_9ASTR|nr:unnamed protein product [Lactuca virosa]
MSRPSSLIFPLISIFQHQYHRPSLISSLVPLILPPPTEMLLFGFYSARKLRILDLKLGFSIPATIFFTRFEKHQYVSFMVKDGLYMTSHFPGCRFAVVIERATASFDAATAVWEQNGSDFEVSHLETLHAVITTDATMDHEFITFSTLLFFKPYAPLASDWRWRVAKTEHNSVENVLFRFCYWNCVTSQGDRPAQALMLWKLLYGNNLKSIWAHSFEELEGLNK